jgi:hypothetical protein
MLLIKVGLSPNRCWIYLRHSRAISQVAGHADGNVVGNKRLFIGIFHRHGFIPTIYLTHRERPQSTTAGRPSMINLNFLIFNSGPVLVYGKSNAVRRNFIFLGNGYEHDHLRSLKSLATQRLFKLEERFHEISRMQC